ncbi:hypothetical protein [Haloferula sp. BvORR071]|uniref:hypothetical protein n=1 Tax=Haloferula sp. BvORR071 TaxID=1396141 RepID=UPI002240F79F|nr:hypothetical protein [Haloferula sp. BvORR071]
MIQTIRSVILPYFSTFEDIPTACELMTRLNIPGIYVVDLLDFLMCFSDQLSTRMAAVNYLDRRPELKPFYAQMFERFARNGIPDYPLYPPPEALAAASIVYQFGDLLDG